MPVLNGWGGDLQAEAPRVDMEGMLWGCLL